MRAPEREDAARTSVAGAAVRIHLAIGIAHYQKQLSRRPGRGQFGNLAQLVGGDTEHIGDREENRRLGR